MGSLFGDPAQRLDGFGGQGEGGFGGGQTVKEGSVPALTASHDAAPAGATLFLDAAPDWLAAYDAGPDRGRRRG
jgi:hypothetical protein